VTVLFADLCGSTALSERLDPEEVRAFQGALFDTFAQANIRYGGRVNNFMGDAVLAVFGHSSTMRIFSSAENCRRVARRMSFTTSSAGCFAGPDVCFIFAPDGYDEPEILPS
jgi:class 3 adenylate cyclase